jgi:2-polyprenyl-3-methyl-5-hydroxy-6-metoxy-1,4-benzoquinol methylase
MNKKDIKEKLKNSYKLLEPYSYKYKVDFDRYLFSLKILTSFTNSQKTKILDVGTGIGIMPLALKQLGFKAYGADLYIFGENNMFAVDDLLKLKTIWETANLDISNFDITNDKVTDKKEYYDIIISEATIEHLKNPKEFFKKCNELLSLGGYLFITTPNLTTLLKRIKFMFGISPNWPVKEFFLEGENFKGHWREYTIKELKQMGEEAGFYVEKCYNKNLLTKFKPIKEIRKNIRALACLLSYLIPGSREMNCVLYKKPES